MIGLLKQIGLVGIVLLGLTALGNAINGFLNFYYLDVFFAILRNVVIPMDFIVPSDTVLSGISWIFTLLVSYWSCRGIILGLKIFNK